MNFYDIIELIKKSKNSNKYYIKKEFAMKNKIRKLAGGKKKLFGNNIKPMCKYCLHGKSIDSDKINCSKYGIVKTYDSCKYFSYSPLKRIPQKEVLLAHSDVNEIDF